MYSDLFVSYETFGEFFRTMEFVELLLLVLCAVVSAGALDLDNGVHLVMIPKSYRLQSFQFDRRIDVGMNGTFREKPLMREISDAINASLDSLNEICDSRAISRREKRSLWGLLGLSTKSEVDVVAQKVAILRAHEDTYRQQMNSIRESAQTLFKQIGDDEAIIQEDKLHNNHSLHPHYHIHNFPFHHNSDLAVHSMHHAPPGVERGGHHALPPISLCLSRH